MGKENQIPLIMIDDEYGISVDPIDYSLRKVTVSEKTGKTRQETKGYFGTIQRCLKEYIAETIHNSVESDKSIPLKEAVERIEAAINKACGIIEKAFPEYEVTRK